MIYINRREITDIFYKHPISAVYIGNKLVWQSINSTIGAGYWGGLLPWNGIDAWNSIVK